MPFTFSNKEYADMHFVYRFCNGNTSAAVEEYQQHFPWQRIPDWCVQICSLMAVRKWFIS